jgi:hypothetical protein
LRPLIALIILVWFNSCTGNRTKTSFVSKKDTTDNPYNIKDIKDFKESKVAPGETIKHPFSAIDSLNKYQDSTNTTYSWKATSMQYGTSTLYIDELNGVWFGIAPNTDTTYALYQKQNDKWKVIFKFDENFGLGKVQEIDLDGDSACDLIVSSSTPYSVCGNLKSELFFFNSSENIFEHCNSPDLMNTTYDSTNHIIHSHWCQTNGMEGSKESYKIKKHSLVFISGVGIGTGLLYGRAHGCLRYYTLKKKVFATYGSIPEPSSNEVDIRIVKYNDDKKMEDDYEHALWDSRDDY